MKLFYYYQRLRTHLYTFFRRHGFASFGAHSLLECPVYRLRGQQRVSVGACTVFGSGLDLTTWGEGRISIGDDCHFGRNNQLTAAFEVIIGNNLLTGANVLISDNSHGQSTRHDMMLPPIDRPLYGKGPVNIGDNVWLGNNVCILSGVCIGDGAIVAANSVVTHDIPPYSVAAGCPARIVKTQSKE